MHKSTSRLKIYMPSKHFIVASLLCHLATSYLTFIDRLVMGTKSFVAVRLKWKGKHLFKKWG